MNIEGDGDEAMDVGKRAVEAVAAVSPGFRWRSRRTSAPGRRQLAAAKVERLERALGTE